MHSPRGVEEVGCVSWQTQYPHVDRLNSVSFERVVEVEVGGGGRGVSRSCLVVVRKAVVLVWSFVAGFIFPQGAREVGDLALVFKALHCLPAQLSADTRTPTPAAAKTNVSFSLHQWQPDQGRPWQRGDGW